MGAVSPTAMILVILTFKIQALRCMCCAAESLYWIQAIDVSFWPPVRIITPETMCRNSEIYNHDDLKATTLNGVQIVKDSKSDSAIIGHLYEKFGDSDRLWQCLDGIFACVVYDEMKDTFMAAR